MIRLKNFLIKKHVATRYWTKIFYLGLGQQRNLTSLEDKLKSLKSQKTETKHINKELKIVKRIKQELQDVLGDFLANLQGAKGCILPNTLREFEGYLPEIKYIVPFLSNISLTGENDVFPYDKGHSTLLAALKLRFIEDLERFYNQVESLKEKGAL